MQSYCAPIFPELSEGESLVSITVILLAFRTVDDDARFHGNRHLTGCFVRRFIVVAGYPFTIGAYDVPTKLILDFMPVHFGRAEFGDKPLFLIDVAAV